jgi:hypothetical protein
VEGKFTSNLIHKKLQHIHESRVFPYRPRTPAKKINNNKNLIHATRKAHRENASA